MYYFSFTSFKLQTKLVIKLYSLLLKLYRIYIGLPQGSLLSPTLFLIIKTSTKNIFFPCWYRPYAGELCIQTDKTLLDKQREKKKSITNPLATSIYKIYYSIKIYNEGLYEYTAKERTNNFITSKSHEAEATKLIKTAETKRLA